MVCRTIHTLHLNFRRMTNPRLTPLERAVLDALAWELRDVAPDLGGQVEECLPGVRRNTGQGAVVELIVARDRPLPATGPTGRFGTVHAMIGGLSEAVAFQVELRAGRLMALHADSYGQDTRPLDFTTVPFDEVFYLDADGASVLYDPAATMPDSPLRDLQKSDDPYLPAYDDPVASDAPPLDPEIAAAVERFQRARPKLRGAPLPAAASAPAPPARPAEPASPALLRSLRIAHVATGVLAFTVILDRWDVFEGLGVPGAWSPFAEIWNRLGLGDPFYALLVPFLAIGFIRKQVERQRS